MKSTNIFFVFAVVLLICAIIAIKHVVFVSFINIPNIPGQVLKISCIALQILMNGKLYLIPQSKSDVLQPYPCHYANMPMICSHFKGCKNNHF